MPPIKILEFKDSEGRFSKLLQIDTTSFSNKAQINYGKYTEFRKLLREGFPEVHKKLDLEYVNEHSMIFHWKGTDANLRPVVLLAHYDVVPAADQEEWTYPPFSGTIADGFIWGRGALDDKISLAGILEAIEKLLEEGFTPKRTIYVCFGHDEETGGKHGAAKIAELLNNRKIQAEFVLDEGMAVTEGIVPDIKSPVALVGLAEKTSLSFRLIVKVPGGHASMPQDETAIDLLSKVVLKLRHHHSKAQFGKAVIAFFNAIGPHLGGVKRFVFANKRLFLPIIRRSFEGFASGYALLHNTIAPTIIKGGVKENVIPGNAEATFNMRLLPGVEPYAFINELNQLIDDKRVSIELLEEPGEVSAVSDCNAEGYHLIRETIEQVFPNAVVAPTLVLGTTDSRHYGKISDNIYRFLPLRMTSTDLQRIHGIDERISRENFQEVLNFYYFLLRKL